MTTVDGHRLVVAGPLTMSTVAQEIDAGRRAVLAGATEIDLSGTTDIDSAALAMVLDWVRTAKKPLKIVGMPQSMASLAALYGVGALIA